MAAVLLGIDIGLKQGGHRLLKFSVEAGPALVRIALHRPQSIVCHLLHILRKHHAHAEPGKPGENRILLHLQTGIHAAVRPHAPYRPDIHDLLHIHRGERQVADDIHIRRPLFSLDMGRAVAPGHRTVILYFPPAVTDIHVIVRGGTPDIVLHGMLKKTLSVAHHTGEQAFELVISIAELS